jgi:Transglutaminase-like superfamily
MRASFKLSHNNMWKRFKQLRKLSFNDWKIVLSSTVLLPATALSLNFFGLKRTQKTLKKLASPPLQNQPDPGLSSHLQEAQNIAKLVNISARHGLFRANCLKQVLVLWFLLNRKNIPSTLHIGIRKKETSQLDAHAWLEYDNTPLIDSRNSLQQFSSIHSSREQ